MNPHPHTATARVFFALWPTKDERARLAAWRTPLKHLCGGRAMRAQTLHATLVFIGNVETNRLDALQQAAHKVCAESFVLSFDEARYWGHNRIVYAAPSHLPQPLMQLVDALAQHLEAQDFKFDRRTYQPHVTLLRNARRNNTPLPSMPPVNWQIRDFTLMQSVQKEGSNEYHVLARFPLRACDG